MEDKEFNTLEELRAVLMKDRRYRVWHYISIPQFWLAWILHRVAWKLEGVGKYEWRCPHCHEIIVEDDWDEEE